jgi:hypothetical protein
MSPLPTTPIEPKKQRYWTLYYKPFVLTPSIRGRLHGFNQGQRISISSNQHLDFGFEVFKHVTMGDTTKFELSDKEGKAFSIKFLIDIKRVN